MKFKGYRRPDGKIGIRDHVLYTSLLALRQRNREIHRFPGAGSRLPAQPGRLRHLPPPIWK